MTCFWQAYQDIFPSKYIQPSNSDRIISKALNKLPPGKALDVGGGVNGTQYLIDWSNSYSLLDPYVLSKLPQIQWDNVTIDLFDAVIARGSINYLVPNQIKQLLQSIKNGGLLAFNTFLNMKEGERIYISHNDSGFEKSRIIDGGLFGMIEHTLEPENSLPIIHSFFYYPSEWFLDIIKSVGLQAKIIKNKNTAVFLCWRYNTK